MDTSNLAHINGIWSIANPDQGEKLAAPTALLVTGGTILIDTDRGIIFADFLVRNGAGQTEHQLAAGWIKALPNGHFEVRFTDDTFTIFSYDGEHLVRISHSRSTVEAGLTLTKAADSFSNSDISAHRIPGILFNTMPKSGSIFILRCLSQGLAIPETKISVCLYPDDLIIRDKLDDLALGNTVVQQHIPARDINLRFLNNRIERMVVHVRDPRQATLSWMHHLDNFYANKDLVPECSLGLEATTPELPENFFVRDSMDRLDYLIETHLPTLVEWTNNWVKAADNATGPKILFTTYEEFILDQEKFLEQILDFFQVPNKLFDWSRLPTKTAQTHYRKGQSNEWESVFSIRQKELAKNVIPHELAERFFWNANI